MQALHGAEDDHDRAQARRQQLELPLLDGSKNTAGSEKCADAVDVLAAPDERIEGLVRCALAQCVSGVSLYYPRVGCPLRFGAGGVEPLVFLLVRIEVCLDGSLGNSPHNPA